MNRHNATRERRKQLDRDNAKQPVMLTLLPIESLPKTIPQPYAVWRSRGFLVQAFMEQNGFDPAIHVLRLSINRTKLRADGLWEDAITWDELMEVKRQIGMGDKYAVEVYPRDIDIVLKANMRHLWVFPSPLPIGWFKP